MNKIINKTIFWGIILSIMLILSLVIPAKTEAYYNGLCLSHSYQSCTNNGLYWYDSCGNQQDLAQYCNNGCYNNICYNNGNNYNNNCTYHSYQSCSGNNLYWYDSCGNQQDLAQYCNNGCSGNTCYNYNYNNYNNYGNCTYHAYKLCSGNNIYWYDSCGNQQDLYTSCQGNQVCQYGQCVYSMVNPVTPPINNYQAYYQKACSNNSVYWYDSLGVISGLYKSCDDNNSCTIDSCSDKDCTNLLKCDGSSCASGSVDYNKYCSTSPAVDKCGDGLCEATIGETNTTCAKDCKSENNANSLLISFFIKQDPTSSQWQKAAQIGSNGQVYMMASITNNTNNQIDNVNISANIPSEISSLGNLQLNGVAISGDIISGINIGTITANSTKSITFEGRTQTIDSASTKSGTATINGNSAQTDSISLNFSPTQLAAATIPISESSGFWIFLKRWYLWIIAALVLIFLFIIVFKRFSSDV